MATVTEILRMLRRGDREKALRRYRLLLAEMNGPGPAAAPDDPLLAINKELDCWEQIRVFSAEAEARPENARTWKLLGLAYARAGVYVPVLLKLAEHAFLAALARETDRATSANIEDKLELARAAAAGDESALAGLVASEGYLSAPTEYLPEEVPVPALLVRAGITREKAVPVNERTVAAGLLESETE